MLHLQTVHSILGISCKAYFAARLPAKCTYFAYRWPGSSANDSIMMEQEGFLMEQQEILQEKREVSGVDILTVYNQSRRRREW